ncbi:unnamed protein product, partial [Pocillopora meandrina]
DNKQLTLTGSNNDRVAIYKARILKVCDKEKSQHGQKHFQAGYGVLHRMSFVL